VNDQVVNFAAHSSRVRVVQPNAVTAFIFHFFLSTSVSTHYFYQGSKSDAVWLLVRMMKWHCL